MCARRTTAAKGAARHEDTSGTRRLQISIYFVFLLYTTNMITWLGPICVDGWARYLFIRTIWFNQINQSNTERFNPRIPRTVSGSTLLWFKNNRNDGVKSKKCSGTIYLVIWDNTSTLYHKTKQCTHIRLRGSALDFPPVDLKASYSFYKFYVNLHRSVSLAFPSKPKGDSRIRHSTNLTWNSYGINARIFGSFEGKWTNSNEIARKPRNSCGVESKGCELGAWCRLLPRCAALEPTLIARRLNELSYKLCHLRAALVIPYFI